MSQNIERSGQQNALELDRGIETLRESSEFHGPIEPIDDHEHSSDHLALIYESREEQFAATIPFIQQGLERGERCLYIADETEPETILDALRDTGANVDAALESGALTILDVNESYLKDGSFDLDESISLLEAAMEEGITEFEGFRVSAEETWLLQDDSMMEEFMALESQVNEVFHREGCMALCQYDRERFPAEVIEDVIKTHTHLVIDNTVSRNFYYTPPGKFSASEEPDAEIDRMMQTLQERTQAKAELQEHKQYLRELYETTANNDYSFEETVEKLLELGCERFDLRGGALSHLPTWDGEFRAEVAVGSGLPDGPKVLSAQPEDDQYCRRTITQDEPTAVPDITELGWEDGPFSREMGCRTYFGIRVAAGTEPYGTLWFYDTSPRDEPFTDDEYTFLEMMGQWVNNELERMEREKRVRDHKQHLNALIETTPECIKNVAEDGTLLQMNSAGLDMVEADSPSDVVGENVYDLIAPEHREKFREFNERICRGERGVLEFDIIGLEGTRLHMESHAAPLRRPDGTTSQVALTRDVTEQKKREQALQESKEQLRALIEVLPVAVFVAEDDGRITEWNDAAEEIWGGEIVESESVAEYDEYDGWWADTGEPVDADEWALARALRGEEVTEPDEIEIEGFDGKRRRVLNHGMPVRNADGEVSRAVVTLIDVTEQKKREAELRQTKNRFETVFEDSDDSIFIVDPEADALVDANPAACRMTGYDRDELLSQAPSDLHSGQLEQFRAFLETVQEEGSAWTEDLRCQTKDGRELATEISASAITLDDRELVLALARDVSERKTHEQYQRDLYEITADADLSFDEKIDQLLDLGRERFDLDMGFFLEKQGDKFGVVRTRGTELENGTAELCANPDQYCKQTITVDKPVGVTDTKAAGWGEDPLYQTYNLGCYLGTRVTDGSGIFGSVCFASSSPREREFTEAEYTFLDLMGQWLSYELQRQQGEMELKETVGQLQQSNDRLQQFAYAASHDLQEPLRMVSSYLQLLESRYKDELDDDAQDYIDFAVDGADRMRAMVEDLLAYSRVEQSDKEFEPVESDAVLERVTTDLQMQIEENAAEIAVESLPTVVADREQLQQLFNNLVSNAIKYNDSETPRVEVAAERGADHWKFSIADNGIGIDPDKTERIFEVFKRLHHDDEYPGTGIGLSLCQEIVENHGGDIWLDSEPGEGSTFSFTLPRRASD